MKTLRMMCFFFVLFMSCNAQNKDLKKENSAAAEPKENVQVNREYDENGNLIKYDSIYSYSYSSYSKLQDSLRLNFQQHFNNHPFFDDSFFDYFFKPDSISGNFNPNHYFFNGFMNQDEPIKNMMKRMDSIQKLFFYQNQGNFNPVKPEIKDKAKI